MSTEKAGLPAVMQKTADFLADFPPDKYNHLLPSVTLVDSSAEFIKPKRVVVTISPDENQQESYKRYDFNADERAITRKGLQKFNDAACVQFPRALNKQVRYVPGVVCVYEAFGISKGSDGSVRGVPKSCTIDVEAEVMDIRRRAKKNNKGALWIESETIRLRRNLALNCETKAQNRVTRALFALKDKYTVAELRLPFVLIRFDTAFDLSDPEVVAKVIAEANKACLGAYGPDPTAGAPSGEEVEQPGPVDLFEGATNVEDAAAAMLARVAKIQNPFEAANWQKKHASKIDALPEDLRAAVFAALEALDHSDPLAEPDLGPETTAPKQVPVVEELAKETVDQLRERFRACLDRMNYNLQDDPERYVESWQALHAKHPKKGWPAAFALAVHAVLTIEATA